MLALPNSIDTAKHASHSKKVLTQPTSYLVLDKNRQQNFKIDVETEFVLSWSRIVKHDVSVNY